MKPSFFQIDRAFFVAFNWTKVELKPLNQGNMFEKLATFNWTKVELKPEDGYELLYNNRDF